MPELRGPARQRVAGDEPRDCLRALVAHPLEQRAHVVEDAPLPQRERRRQFRFVTLDELRRPRPAGRAGRPIEHGVAEQPRGNLVVGEAVGADTSETGRPPVAAANAFSHAIVPARPVTRSVPSMSQNRARVGRFKRGGHGCGLPECGVRVRKRGARSAGCECRRTQHRTPHSAPRTAHRPGTPHSRTPHSLASERKHLVALDPLQRVARVDDQRKRSTIAG